MMTLQGAATRLTILVKESDLWRHKPLYTEIVHRAHQAGLAGTSVFHGIEGYGKSSRIHTSRILSLTEDLPVMIVIVDLSERIEAFQSEIDAVVTEGLVMIDQVEVVKYVSRAGGSVGAEEG